MLSKSFACCTSCLLYTSDEDKEEGLLIAKRFSAIGYGILATKGTADYLQAHGLYVKTVQKDVYKRQL